MAFDLVTAYATTSDDPFYKVGEAAKTITEAPQQITLRFSPGAKIDAATLTSGNISIVRSGGAGDRFGTAGLKADVPIVPGSITVNDLPNDNEVIVRFADTLPDDTYRITIGVGLKTTANDTATPRSIEFRLDLGAFVMSVVPQPVSRSGAALSQNRNTIEVHFNANDPLNVASAQTAASYRVFEVNPTTGVDVAPTAPVNPAAVTYDSATGRAVLTFAPGAIADGKLYRLQIGGVVVAPAASATEGSDNNSSFSTARDLGAIGKDGLIVTGAIAQRTTVATPAGTLGFPTQNGAIDSPGHRDIPVDSGAHGKPSVSLEDDTATDVQYYNFKDVYGVVNDVPQQNAITETQKQRAREVFELFSRYTGIRFIESAGDGMTVATGDVRAAKPTAPRTLGGIGGPGRAIMNSSLDWGKSEYGGDWFKVAVHEIGHALGLEHSYDIPSMMGKGLSGEQVFPGDYDIEQLRQLYPANGPDVDVYKFTLADAGRLSAETIIARPGQPLYDASTLDSLLTLYRQDSTTGRREIVARNDDSFGRDSFIGLGLAAGTYFLAVSSTGNDAFNPEVSDSGYGGRTDGAYQLKFSFQPASVAANTIIDTSGTPFDGDRDGKSGGAFNFWFNTASTADTIFVDKTAANGGNGSIGMPYKTIKAAIENIGSKKIIRIVGNAANAPYLVGTTLGGQPLEDGATFNVPKGVTVMIDAGAIFKLRATNIDVGSSSALVDRSGASLQVLGTPGSTVTFTSYHDDSIGGNSDGLGPAVSGGQWGGIVVRRDSDSVSKKAFVNSIAGAAINFGGGQVFVDSQLDSFAPIQLETTRPTLAFNTIQRSAGPAISASPASFEESDGRIGPELRGNRLLNNSINGLFIKVQTPLSTQTDKLNVPARLRSTDVVYVLQDILLIDGGVGGYLNEGTTAARRSGRLTIDPGVVVKLQGARIELERGTAQLIAEGTAGQSVIFTSLGDNRFGAGGTFDTNGNLPDVRNPGDWGGIIVNAGGKASIDYAYLGFGGGQTPIEGGFDKFNVIEAHQGDLRLAHSRVENNAAGQATGDRNSRGTNAAATIFVRGAQPVILGNDFRDNLGTLVSINANSLTDALLPDPGRSSGSIGRDARYDDNRGPLVRDNKISYTINAAAGRPAGGATGGMEVRGEEITVESVWDDVDIVHVLKSEIIVQNLHTYTGVRLMSQVNASLVVKLLNGETLDKKTIPAGFTAAGYGLDIDDRIGGTVQVVGQPGYPVILTSLADDTVGASLDPLGRQVKDTNNNGSATSPTPGDWRSLQFLPMSNDRNVAIVKEAEQSVTQGVDLNSTPGTAQRLGVLAPNFATGSNTFDSAQEKSGDEIRRLGFEVHGFISSDDPTDVDVYAFTGFAGSEVWIDIDKTSPSLDTMVELLDAAGNVRARSADSQLEGGIQQESLPGTATADLREYAFRLSRPGFRRETVVGYTGTQTLSINAAGNVVLSTLGSSVFPPYLAISGKFDAATGVLTLTYDRVPTTTPRLTVEYAYATTSLAEATKGLAQPLARDAVKAGDHYSTNPKDAGMRVVLPGDGQPKGTPIQYFVRVRSQPRYEPVATGASNGTVAETNSAAYEAALVDTAKVKTGATSGAYELRVRLRQLDEKPGSTVRYADIRYPTIGLDVQGLPRNSPLVGETGEASDSVNNAFEGAQYVGNLLQTDRNTISIAGNVAGNSDVDWYTFALNYEQIQCIAGLSDGTKTWSTVFDLDYGDGIRGDLTIAVYNSAGQLLYIGRDSNVASDQPEAGQGSDSDDLSRGSVGSRDPFIGPVHMPAGNPTGSGSIESGDDSTPPDPSKQLRYYVAVFSGGLLPAPLSAVFDGGTANSLVRLEPVNSVTRVVEDHIGFTGYTTGPARLDNGSLVAPSQSTPLFDLKTLSTHVTPFTLSDVTLFVATGSSLVTVDAMRGSIETTLPENKGADDIVMRSDGRLYGYRSLDKAGNTAGTLDRIDSGTGARTNIGNDSIPNAPAVTPVQATETNVGVTQTGAVNTTTFSLANKNVQPATMTGTLQYTAAVSGYTVTGTWTFTVASNGTVTFTPVSQPAGLAKPQSGTVAGAAGVLSVTWDTPVAASGVAAATMTYSYDPDPNAVTTDQVDAMAWNFNPTVSPQINTLFYSVREGVKSRLYRVVNPPAGDAVTGGSAATGRIGGSSGYIQTASNDLGITTGMAFLDGILYGVDDTGKFFTINTGGTGNLATLLKKVDGLPKFSGLTVGPQNLQNGFFKDKLFAITEDGTLYCLSKTGDLQIVFDSNNDGVADKPSCPSGAKGASGLAFSPLDINLWHPTLRRASDAGHGVNATLDPDAKKGALSIGDNTRDGTFLQEYGTKKFAETVGGASMYFGFEQYVEKDAPYEPWGSNGGQYGVQSSTWQAALSENTAIRNTYNLPGGAYGSLTTNSFSLAGRTYADKPTLYFNYFLQSDPAASAAGDKDTMRDSARVFISADGGVTWDLLATNNPTSSTVDKADSELPTFLTTSSDRTKNSNQHVQQLYRDGTWRQARVDLGKWANQADLRLRIDFSTAGEFDATQKRAGRAVNTTVTTAVSDAAEVTVADASGIVEGMTVGSGTTTVIAVDAMTKKVTLSANMTLSKDDQIIFSFSELLNNISDVANTTGNFGSEERGQKNNYEGFYVDDFIVGFAERGEMVTGAATRQTGFYTLPTADPSPKVPAENIQGQYQLEIRRGMEYGDQPDKLKSDVVVANTLDTNADLVRARSFGFRGDENNPREQGQFIIESNLVSNAKTYGISIDAGRNGETNAPTPGTVLNTAALNSARLVPGVVVMNNVIAMSGAAGILFSGEANSGSVPTAAVPFGRIVNNTIVGISKDSGTGIVVNENAGPTLLNNLFANVAKGITVDLGSRANTVVGTSAYWNTPTPVTGITESQPITLDGDPFVNAAAGNFYLRLGSKAIDSGISSLDDRPAFVAVKQSLGIPESQIISPDRDLYGQLRGDDPTQASAPGLGSNVFKDRGAIDRVDFVQPSAALAVPLDDSTDDQDSSPGTILFVRQAARSITTFQLQLNDYGVGIDKATVIPGAFELRRNGSLLVAGTDYLFNYLESSNRVVFESPSVFAMGRYVISVVQTAGDAPVSVVADLAGNPLPPNQLDGTTKFTIELADVPTAPTNLVASSDDQLARLSWNASTTDGNPLVKYQVQRGTDEAFSDPKSIDVPPSDPRFTDTPLVNGTQYWFRVRAVNSVGLSEWSNVAGPVVPLPIPTFSFVDTGVSDVDGITKNGLVTVENVVDGATWQYSIDSGATWSDQQPHTTTSFPLLLNAQYVPGAVRIRQFIDSSFSTEFFNTSTITVDTNAPDVAPVTAVADYAPIITGPVADGGTTNDTELDLSGTTDAGTTVEIFDGDTKLGNARVIGTNWTFTTGTLVNGSTYVFKTQATDLAGNIGPKSLPHTVTIDTTAPAAPTITAIGDDVAPITGPVANGGVTNDTVLLLSGTTDAGTTVEILNGATKLGNATVIGTSWTFTTGTLVNGTTYAFSARAANAAGNTASSAAHTVTVDTSAPAAPAITGALDDQPLITGNVASGGSTNDTTLVLSGTTAAGTTVEVFSGATKLGDATVTGTTWSFTTAALATATTYSFTAKATDAAGNTSTSSAAYTVTIHTTAPAAPTIASVTDNVAPVIGPVASSGATNDTILVLAGTTDAGTTVEIFNGVTKLGNATVTGTSWTYTTPTLTDGTTYVFKAIASDAVGNVSADSATHAVTIDTTAPAAPAIVMVTDNVAPVTGDVANGGITNDTVLALSGTTLAGTTVEIFNGVTKLGNAIVTGTAWSFTTAVLTHGTTYAFKARAVDAAGNTSADSSTRTVTIDTDPPSSPLITAVTDDVAPITGPVANGGVTNDTVLLLSGTTAAGTTVEIFTGATKLGSATVTGTNWTYTTPTLTDGTTYVFKAVASDAAGNTSADSATHAVTIDITPPAAPSIGAADDNVAPVTGNVPSGGVTNDPTPTFTGTAEAGAVVTVRRDGTPIGTATANGSGLWTLTTPGLANGSHTFTAVATDAAGNTSTTSASYAIAVDTIVPATPVISAVIDDVPVLVGTVASGGRTNDNEFRIVGTAEPGAAIVVRSGATLLGSGTADGTGNWEFTTARLGDGSYSLTAVANDAAGNTSPASSPAYVVIVDTSAPSAAVITSVADNFGSITGNVAPGGRTDDTTLRIAGTAEPGSLVTVRSGNAVLRRVYANSSGNWVAVTDALASRVHNLNAFTRDIAGNNGVASPNHAVTVDTTGPSILSLGSSTTVGSYGQGSEIAIFARTSERMRAGSAIDITLNTGAVVRLSTASERSELNGIYRVAPGGLAAPLSIVSIANVSPVASDIAGNPVVSLPTVPFVLSGISVDSAIRAFATGFASTQALAPAINMAVSSIEIVFTTEVTGVSLAALRLFYNERESVSLRDATITGSGRTYTLTLPAALTNRVGSYRLTIGPSSAIRAVDGNAPMDLESNAFWNRV